MKNTFDKRAKPRDFIVGDLVFKWNEFKSRAGRNSKFDAMWDGPYVITECKEHNAFQLSKMTGEVFSIPVNGIHLKHCL